MFPVLRRLSGLCLLYVLAVPDLGRCVVCRGAPRWCRHEQCADDTPSHRDPDDSVAICRLSGANLPPRPSEKRSSRRKGVFRRLPRKTVFRADQGVLRRLPRNGSAPTPPENDPIWSMAISATARADPSTPPDQPSLPAWPLPRPRPRCPVRCSQAWRDDGGARVAAGGVLPLHHAIGGAAAA